MAVAPNTFIPPDLLVLGGGGGGGGCYSGGDVAAACSLPAAAAVSFLAGSATNGVLIAGENAGNGAVDISPGHASAGARRLVGAARQVRAWAAGRDAAGGGAHNFESAARLNTIYVIGILGGSLVRWAPGGEITD